LDGCEVSAPCTQDALAAAQSAIRALFISIAVGLVVAVLVFWFSVATINRRHRQELESKKAIPSYTLH
jgi:CHASE3 domain sensor protein